MATTVKRVAKQIEGEDLEYLLSLTPDDISQDMIYELFGEFEGKCRMHPYDAMQIPAGAYGVEGYKNKSKIDTCVGIYIFNLAFILMNPTIFKQVGYYNEIITDGTYSDLTSDLTYYLEEDKITVEDYRRYCDMSQMFMPLVSVLAPGFTEGMFTCTKKLNVRKAQLLKENAAAIKAGDIKVVDQIQKELLAYAREILAEDPAMDMYASGAMGSFDNNFKNMFIMRGAVKNPDPTKGYDVITSNYIEGIAADEYQAFANSLAEGPYNRSKKTEVGGYWEKLMVAACQNVNLLEPGTDCGTKHTIKVHLTKKNLNMIMYSYIVEKDGSLVELTTDNRDKYMDKDINIRFSSMCRAKDGICSICGGNAFYRQGLRNIGVRTAEIPSKIKNIFMKSFHDAQIRLFEMDPMEAFGMK